MKRSLRSISLLLLLFTILTSLLSRSAIITFSFFLPQTPNYSRTNATILSISAHDASHSFTQTQVSDLLHASLESFNTIGAKYRTISLWHRLGFDRRRCLARIRLPISDQTGTYPPDRHVILPLFRHSLSKWAHYHNLNFSSSNSLTLELMQRVNNPIRTYDTCAVVGNSGILLGSNHGELIDSHEFVIRLNNARIVGYERDVGSKSSLSFVNSNILHLCTRRDKCDCHPYGKTVPILMYICQPRHFLDYVVCNSSHIAPLLITDPRFDKLCARIAKYYSLKRFVDSTGQSPAHWNTKHDETTFHYSSGFQAVILALRICKRVSVFGFGKLTGAKHHYHTNQKAELALHDYEAEYMFYTDLIQRPQMIRLFAEIEVPNFVFYH